MNEENQSVDEKVARIWIKKRPHVRSCFTQGDYFEIEAGGWYVNYQPAIYCEDNISSFEIGCLRMTMEEACESTAEKLAKDMKEQGYTRVEIETLDEMPLTPSNRNFYRGLTNSEMAMFKEKVEEKLAQK